MENNKALAAIHAYSDAIHALDAARNLLRRARQDLEQLDHAKITATLVPIHATGTAAYITRYCGGLAKDIATDTATGNKILKTLKNLS